MDALWVIGAFLIKPPTWIALILALLIWSAFRRRLNAVRMGSSDGEKLIIALICCVAFLLLPREVFALLIIGCVIYLAVRWALSSKAKAAPPILRTERDYWLSLPGVLPPSAASQSIWKRLGQYFR